MVVPADRPKCALWHAPILGFSRGLGIGEKHSQRTSQEIGSVWNHGTGACLGWQRLPRVCLDQEGPRAVPCNRRLAPVGRKLSLFPRRETSPGTGQTHPQTRAQAGSAKHERGNPYGERSGTRYCDELNGRFTASNLFPTPGRKASQYASRCTIALSTMLLQCRPCFPRSLKVLCDPPGSRPRLKS